MARKKKHAPEESANRISKALKRVIRESFWDYQELDLNFDDVIEANVSKQRCGYEPRPWYVGIRYLCRDCKDDFVFTAKEQQFWYEDLAFYVGAHPVCCVICRKDRRRLKALKERYDALSNLSDEQIDKETAQEMLDLMVELFDAPFSERLLSKYNHLVKIVH